MDAPLQASILTANPECAIPSPSVIPGFWDAVLRVRCRVPRSCSAEAQGDAGAGLLLPGPNEYEWAPHNRGFVSLNSFTPQCPRKGFPELNPELNVNHTFTGTKPPAWRGFSKTSHFITGGSSAVDSGLSRPGGGDPDLT